MAVADQEGNEEIDQRGKGTGEMTEPAWLRHTHDHNHHTALNYVSLLSMSLIFRLLIFSTIVTLIFHLYHLPGVIILLLVLGCHLACQVMEIPDFTLLEFTF